MNIQTKYNLHDKIIYCQKECTITEIEISVYYTTRKIGKNISHRRYIDIYYTLYNGEYMVIEETKL